MERIVQAALALCMAPLVLADQAVDSRGDRGEREFTAGYQWQSDDLHQFNLTLHNLGLQGFSVSALALAEGSDPIAPGFGIGYSTGLNTLLPGASPRLFLTGNANQFFNAQEHLPDARLQLGGYYVQPINQRNSLELGLGAFKNIGEPVGTDEYGVYASVSWRLNTIADPGQQASGALPPEITEQPHIAVTPPSVAVTPLIPTQIPAPPEAAQITVTRFKEGKNQIFARQVFSTSASVLSGVEFAAYHSCSGSPQRNTTLSNERIDHTRAVLLDQGYRFIEPQYTISPHCVPQDAIRVEVTGMAGA